MDQVPSALHHHSSELRSSEPTLDPRTPDQPTAQTTLNIAETRPNLLKTTQSVDLTRIVSSLLHLRSDFLPLATVLPEFVVGYSLSNHLLQ